MATAYQQYLADGGNPDGWEAYRIAKNAESATLATERLLSTWRNGGEISGQEVANYLLSIGKPLSGNAWQDLQHEDTLVSLTSVSGRFGRRAASMLHRALIAILGPTP